MAVKRPEGWVTYRRTWAGVKGMTKLRRILMEADKDVGNVIKIEVKEFANRVRMTASREARTGKMASATYAGAIGVKISRAGFSANVGLVNAAAQKEAWYAHFIEFGTKAGLRQWKGKTKRVMRRRTGSFQHPGTPARPVLFPAFEKERPGMSPRIKAAIDKVLSTLASGPDT